VDFEQESKERLATWVLVQIYTQSSFLCLYVLAYKILSKVESTYIYFIYGTTFVSQIFHGNVS
jgi:hypothetical protein